MKTAAVLLLALLPLGPAGSAAPPPAAEPAAPARADVFARLPVKEVTVFKDGHAFVVHEGEMPVEPDGTVRLDYLPTPVLGTFWPYAAEPDVKIASVTAGRRRVSIRRTALTLREILEANPGAEALVTERQDEKTTVRYPATILGVPERSGEELSETGPPGAEERLPEKGSLVLLKTEEGTKAVPVDRILDVTLKKPPETKAAEEEFRNLLTLRLDRGSKPPKKTVRMGLGYVQKGIRWIPNYRIALDGKGEAVVALQATILNELADIEGAPFHLVVGVPSFAFQGQADPMALQAQVAQLSAYFASGPRDSNYLSNAVAVQTQGNAARWVEEPPAAPAGPDLGPAGPEGARNEDLYVFPVGAVSLRKGERMVLPVAEAKAKYRDVFVLDVPFAPPPEVRGPRGGREADAARLLAGPKAVHTIRIANAGPHPFTTAPAMVLADGKILAQGLMTFTPKGASADLETTAAVDLLVKRTDAETKRQPSAYRWDGDDYARIDLGGEIRIANRRGEAVDLEITRRILGTVDGSEQGGEAAMESGLEDDAEAPARGVPPWWSGYAWPAWWHHVNGIGRISWKVRLEPGKDVALGYRWHYYWR